MPSVLWSLGYFQSPRVPILIGAHGVKKEGEESEGKLRLQQPHSVLNDALLHPRIEHGDVVVIPLKNPLVQPVE